MSRSCPPSVVAFGFLVVVALGGCSARPPAPVSAGVPDGVRGEWVSPVALDHPLVGSVYDVAGDRPVSFGELASALAGAEIVLLGEQHDNVDHHRLQARLLQDMIATGRRPAIAFEQLDLDDQAAVDAFLREHGAAETDSVAARASALAEVVDWKKSGWPPFEEYRPVFETVLRAGLPIRAANLSREAMRHVLTHTNPSGRGGHATEAAVSSRDVELSEDARASLAADIKDSHCGYADARMVAAMTEAQGRRDDAMAAVVATALDASARGGVVLIAGFGHARTDYGVPIYLYRRAPGRRLVSVAFVEVLPDLTSPAAYAGPLHARSLPFDYVIFTPRADGEDPCVKFRAGLEKMKSR